MKLRKNKWLAAAGSIAALAAPVAALVSCGGSSGVGRYDTENDGQIEIGTTFSATGPQVESLNAIVKVYNKQIADGKLKRADGYLPAKVKQVSGGYGDVVKTLRKDFVAKNKKGLVNMVIDYPASAAILQSYDMGLDLRDYLSAEEATALKNKFDQDFFKQNDNIGGIKPGGIVSVPISVSTMANAVNTPLFAYVVTEINRIQHGSIDVTNANGESARIKKLFDEGKKSQGDMDYIRAAKDRNGKPILWGSMDKTKLGSVDKEALKIDDSVFDNWDKLIDFVSAAQVLFGRKVNDKSELHLLALDSPTNLLDALSYAYADGDMSKFYVTKDASGQAKFKAFTDDKSGSYKTLKSAIELLRKGVDSGAVWIGGTGAYGSPYLINHQAMFSLGSTGGASHWYAGDNLWVVKKVSSGRVESHPEDVHFKGDKITKPDRIIDGSHENKINPSGTADADVKNYDFVLESGVTIDKDLKDKKQIVLVAADKIASLVAAGAKVVAVQKGAGKKLLVVDAVAADKIKDLEKDAGAKKVKFGASSVRTLTNVEFGSHGNSIYPHGTETVKDKDGKITSGPGKYDLVFDDGITSKSMATAKKNSGYDTIVSIPHDDIGSFEKTYAGKFLKIVTKMSDTPDERGNEKIAKVYYFVKKGEAIEIKGKEKTLQESEVEGLIMPQKLSDKTKGSIYVQGPSIIPVHANTPEDKATALFVQWFMDTSHKYDFSKAALRKSKPPKDPVTVVDFWMKTAQYVVPLAGAFKTNSSVEKTVLAGFAKSRKYWLGTKIVLDSFKKSANDPNLIPLIRPVDDFTAIARNNVTDPAVKKIYTYAHTNGSTKDFNAIYKAIKGLADFSDVI